MVPCRNHVAESIARNSGVKPSRAATVNTLRVSILQSMCSWPPVQQRAERTVQCVGFDPFSIPHRCGPDVTRSGPRALSDRLQSNGREEAIRMPAATRLSLREANKSVTSECNEFTATCLEPSPHECLQPRECPLPTQRHRDLQRMRDTGAPETQQENRHLDTWTSQCVHYTG